MQKMPECSKDVLDRFRRGDADAFELIFREQQATVYRWILRIVRDAGTAEDLTVEAFWRIYRAHARFDSERGFEPWARRIATHVALDWLRAQKRESAITPELEATLASEGTSNPGVLAEIRAKTAEAFARLPAKLRAAAVLAVLEDQPHKVVADSLGISVTGVKLRVFRALRLLRKDLEQQGIRP
jgi:RNA polymerase sigma-70 factor (ECF subfamily)